MNKFTIQKLLLGAADYIDNQLKMAPNYRPVPELVKELREAAQEVENMPEARFAIVRHFQRSGHKQVIKRNLPLSLAQEHCRNPESSSSTCTKPENKRRTRKRGPWFDGYTQQ